MVVMIIIIIIIITPAEAMLSLPQPRTIIAEAPLTLFKINSKPIVNTKICTLTASPPCTPLLPI